jgi:N-acetylneuraminic acid mutarotase
MIWSYPRCLSIGSRQTDSLCFRFARLAVVCWFATLEVFVDITLAATTGRLSRRVVLATTSGALVALSFGSAAAQSNEWAWMAGTETQQPAVYGTVGVTSAANLPGRRSAAADWADKQGNLWLFGGNGFDAAGRIGLLNDMWEFDPTTNQWTWVGGSSTFPNAAVSEAPGVPGTQGIPAPGNIPAGRTSPSSWTDAKGNFWLFGGQISDSNSAFSNELWEFNPGTREWAWISGTIANASCAGVPSCAEPGVYGQLGVAAPANTPGARNRAQSWTDLQGNFWLFGGYGNDASGSLGWLNDLWEFNPSIQQWTWVSGSTTIPTCIGDCGQPGVYGTQGISLAGNVPGARYSPSGWTDSKGNLWLWGGYGFDSAGTLGLLNDLWQFNQGTHIWTWMGGSSTLPSACSINFNNGECGPPAVYGTRGIPAGDNVPGSRQGAASWTDVGGNFWLFGGSGLDSAGNWGYLGDLWEYSTGTNQWTWMGGSNTLTPESVFSGEPGVYGQYQVPALGNIPSGRNLASTWTDAKGNFWLFGGVGTSEVGVWGYFQDMWEFQPNTGAPQITATPTFSLAPGTYALPQSVALYDSTPGATIYYTINGNTPALKYTAPIPVSSSLTIEAIAGTAGIANSDIARTAYTIQAVPPAAPTFSPGFGSYSTPQTVAISDTTPSTILYYTVDGTVPTPASTMYTGPISVSSTQTIRAIAVGSGSLASVDATGVYTIGSTSSLGQWAWMGGSDFNHAGTYGTQGTASAGNLPGSRAAPVSWTDSDGNFWLFGGVGYDSTGLAGNLDALNDLWEYKPATGQWTWVRGTSDVSCTYTFGWCEVAGVYGTLGVSAPGNTPGGRSDASGWADSSGNLWLFGGTGYSLSGTSPCTERSVHPLNDLWKFSMATGQWTWVSGSSSPNYIGEEGCGQPGVYGQLGVPSAANVPGARAKATTWMDPAGNLWLFGGEGFDDTGWSYGVLNDLWKFNPTTTKWTWMAGGNELIACSSTYGNCGLGGTYGTLGVPSVANSPGSRTNAVGWTDASGNPWLFGGQGYDAHHASGSLNDLWKFDTSSNVWIWMAGSSTVPCPVDPLDGYKHCTNATGVFGTLGVPAAGNTPPGSPSSLAWTDAVGNFWLYGGSAPELTDFGGGVITGLLNDLWVFNPSVGQWAWMGGDYAASNCTEVLIGDFICAGAQPVHGAQTIPAAANDPGARSASATWVDKSGNLWLFGGSFTDTGAVTQKPNDLWKYQPSTSTFPLAAKPIFSLPPAIYLAGGPLQISNGMANASIYYTTDGSTPTPASPLYTGPLTLSSSETVQAIAAAPGYRNSSIASTTYTFAPGPVPPVLSLAAGTYTSVQTLAMSDATGGASIYYTTDGTAPVPSSPVYGAPIPISSSETITALAAAVTAGDYVSDGFAIGTSATLISPLVSANYILNLPAAAAPIFSPTGGTYTAVQAVTISDTLPAATIFYTTDGTTPTIASARYTGSIAVSSSQTVNAIAVATGYANAIASAVYTINLPPAATPVLSLPGGTYTTLQTLTISDATPGAVLYYTKDGTTPTLSSTRYTGPILLSSSEKIEVIAVASGYSPSAVAVADYTVVLAPDFQFTVTPPIVSISAGSSQTATLTITPKYGFNASVNFACSGLTSQESCTFSPISLTPNGAPISTVLTITTTVAKARLLPPIGSICGPLYALLIPGFGMLLGFRSRRRYALPALRLFNFAFLLVLSLALTACGSANSGSATSSGSPGTSSDNAITVTASAASGTTHSASMTVILVQ